MNWLDDGEYLIETYMIENFGDEIWAFSRHFIGTCEEKHAKSQYILRTGDCLAIVLVSKSHKLYFLNQIVCCEYSVIRIGQGVRWMQGCVF